MPPPARTWARALYRRLAGRDRCSRRGATPIPSWVRGSPTGAIDQLCDGCRARGWVLAQCAIDNLVKGAAGQAIQAMNVRFGLPEGAGLEGSASWP